MLESNVYVPLEKLLEERGYKITGLSTEKHGFVTKEYLLELGFSGNEIAPVPFMIWFIIERIS